MSETEELYTYRVYLDGSIDEDKAREVIADLHYASTTYPGCEIEFIINSGGGTIADGTAIYSELRAMSERGGGEHFVTTKIRGMAGSIATLIFEAGDRRVGGPLDYLMYHEAKICTTDEFVSSVTRRIADLAAWEEACLSILMERATVPAKVIAALTGPVDREMLISEAISLGLADAIA